MLHVLAYNACLGSRATPEVHRIKLKPSTRHIDTRDLLYAVRE